MTALPFQNAPEALDYLVAQGQAKDSDIDILNAALAFSIQDSPHVDISTYQLHITAMQDALKDNFETLSAQMNSDNTHVMHQALTQVMAIENGYIGDDITYDDLKNINMFSVIDRRQGMPISLSILAIALARFMGWIAKGVNFPGHFIMRLDYEGDRLMLDPFQACQILEAKDLRVMLKRSMGEGAELSADYYTACTNRDILLRYQNNLKFRLIDQERYGQALDIVNRMALIAPHEYRLSLDRAVLFARQEQPRAAIDALTIYIENVKDAQDKAEAQAFLTELQRQLN